MSENNKNEEKSVKDDDNELPQCKIKRNYSCPHCVYFTQNPRFYLTHLRDVHGERININRCNLCLYASRHYQKLVRHMKMVHGSTEGIQIQSRKRPLVENIPTQAIETEFENLPPMPSIDESTFNIDNLSKDLESSRKTLMDIAVLYFAENEILVKEILKKIEESDAQDLIPSSVQKTFSENFNFDNFVGDNDKIRVGDYLASENLSEYSDNNFQQTAIDLSKNGKKKFFIEKEDLEEEKYSPIYLKKSEVDKDGLSKMETASEDKSSPRKNEMSKNTTFKEEKGSSLKKVYKCPRCLFWSSTASRFHVHVVGHLNRKPYKCSLCSYRSNWRWDVIKHIRLRLALHKNARVLFNGETAPNYAKYNSCLAWIKIPDKDGVPTQKKCGEIFENQVALPASSSELDMSTIFKENLNNNDLSPNETKQIDTTKNVDNADPNQTLVSVETSDVRVQPHVPRDYVIVCPKDDLKNIYKCKMCSFSHQNRDAVLVHVKICHEAYFKDLKSLNESYTDVPIYEENLKESTTTKASESSDTNILDQINALTSKNSSSKRSTNAKLPAPFRCWHCHQESTWKHVIQRHCRLKHSGSVRIEALDQKSDKNFPTYQPLELFFDKQSTQTDKNNESLKKGENKSKIQLDTVKISARNSSVDTVKKMEGHSNSDLIFEQFNCLICSYVTEDKNLFEIHKSKHKIQKFICEKCDLVFQNKQSLNKHLKTHDLKNEPKNVASKTIEMEIKSPKSDKKENSLSSEHDNNVSNKPLKGKNILEKPLRSQPLGNKTVFVNPKTGQVLRKKMET